MNIRVKLPCGLTLFVRNARISEIFRGIAACNKYAGKTRCEAQRVVWLVRNAGAGADKPHCVDCTIEVEDWCDAVWVSRGKFAYRYFFNGRASDAFYDTPEGWQRQYSGCNA